MSQPPIPPPPPSRRRPPRSFASNAVASELVTAADLTSAAVEVRKRLNHAQATETEDDILATVLVEQGVLTRFQADQLLAGKRKLTLGHYRILDAVGQGGMGQVFQAKHLLMGRIVAVKVLPRARSNPQTEAAFRREIQHIASLDHRNLVYALDAGHDGKVYYLVTELVDGIDLRRQVLRYGPLNEVAAASVVAQAARGLAHAHARGFIHRDVKPGNLLVREDGLCKVSDLGLAGSVLDPESMKPGRIVGTMDYMAPEQILRPDLVTPAADMYGLGCTLFFALCGRVPFPGGSRDEKRRRQLEETPERIHALAPTVSKEFAVVVEKMMAKDVAHRYQTAEEVLEAVHPWLTGSLVPMSRVKRSRHRDATVPITAASQRATRGHWNMSEETHHSTSIARVSIVDDDSTYGIGVTRFLKESFAGLRQRLSAAAPAVVSSGLVGLFVAVAWNIFQVVGGSFFERARAGLQLQTATASGLGFAVFLALLLVQVLGAMKIRGRSRWEHL
ncbi:MAG: serine/threonine-protein kinase [Pirellulales bacterium]|jgi:serine/threonine protein kinase